MFFPRESPELFLSRRGECCPLPNVFACVTQYRPGGVASVRRISWGSTRCVLGSEFLHAVVFADPGYYWLALRTLATCSSQYRGGSVLSGANSRGRK